MFSLKRDKEERRRERIIAHLIEAYSNLEKASNRQQDNEMMSKVETSLAAICLLGSKQAANSATKFMKDSSSSSGGDVKPLLSVLRADLRKELGLEVYDMDIPIFRFQKTG